MQKIFRYSVTILIGLLIGVGISVLYQKQQNHAADNTYQVVVGPTKAAKVSYTKNGSGYSYSNPKRHLTVIVKHSDTYALYRLVDNQ